MYAAQQQHLMLQTAALQQQQQQQQQHLSSAQLQNLAAAQQASLAASRAPPVVSSSQQNPSQPLTQINLTGSPQIIQRPQAASSTPPTSSGITQQAVLLGSPASPALCTNQAQMYLRAQMLIFTPTATVSNIPSEVSPGATTQVSTSITRVYHKPAKEQVDTEGSDNTAGSCCSDTGAIPGPGADADILFSGTEYGGARRRRHQPITASQFSHETGHSHH
ncbi:hypothetical protein GDO81_014476 [Engystomops pustulosus]|uniref:Uncharacterized protein n=1 Tax=Engystomops pustulosus TaxID=76066 RepID=A0AAV7BB46_ENGPU|nr:hypothetical protein GDO81_014476 [Engystomops pustulosus]